MLESSVRELLAMGLHSCLKGKKIGGRLSG